MILQTEILENLYTEFIKYLKSIAGEDFQAFKASTFIDKNENYKYAVYEQARDKLGNKFWKPEDIGTGKIQQKVNSAIEPKVIYNYKSETNNLIDWRKKDDFSKLSKSKSLEGILFNLYKSKIEDSKSYELLIKEGLSYQFVAYLFFIKDKQRFLPIAQERFDEIFELLGVPDFKTSGNASWENYSEYCNTIKQVRGFLKTKDKDTTLLDAHTFLWILGAHMREIRQTKLIPAKLEELDSDVESYELLKEVEDGSITNRNPKWERDEIILALDLYFRLESGQIHARNPQVIELSEILNRLPIHSLRPDVEKFRNPNGVGLKLSNFLAIDPSYEGKGMEAYSKLDKEIFFEFVNDKNKLRQIADKIKRTVANTEISEKLEQISDEKSDEIKSVKEGRVLYKLHKYRERDISITKKKKKQYFRIHGCLRCEVCDFDFVEKYGDIGIGFIECHHKVPLSEFESITETKLEDLALVCANCHRMLHKGIDTLNIDELRRLILENSNGTL